MEPLSQCSLVGNIPRHGSRVVTLENNHAPRPRPRRRPRSRITIHNGTPTKVYECLNDGCHDHVNRRGGLCDGCSKISQVRYKGEWMSPEQLVNNFKTAIESQGYAIQYTMDQVHKNAGDIATHWTVIGNNARQLGYHDQRLAYHDTAFAEQQQQFEEMRRRQQQYDQQLRSMPQQIKHDVGAYVSGQMRPVKTILARVVDETYDQNQRLDKCMRVQYAALEERGRIWRHQFHLERMAKKERERIDKSQQQLGSAFEKQNEEFEERFGEQNEEFEKRFESQQKEIQTLREQLSRLNSVIHEEEEEAEGELVVKTEEGAPPPVTMQQ